MLVWAAVPPERADPSGQVLVDRSRAEALAYLQRIADEPARAAGARLYWTGRRWVWEVVFVPLRGQGREVVWLDARTGSACVPASGQGVGAAGSPTRPAGKRGTTPAPGWMRR